LKKKLHKRIKVKRKIESTTPARPFIFSMSDGFVVWPPLLQKEGKLLSPKLLKVYGNAERGTQGGEYV